MFLDIHKIPEEGVRFDRELRPGPLEGPAGETISVSGVRLRGSAVPGDRGADFEAHLDAALTLTCGRCLEPVPFRVSTEVRLRLVPEMPEAPAGHDVELDAADALLYAAPEGKVDLTELVTEQLYLALPLKPLCDEACKGLCPECGANRNRTECACRREDVDPRLAPLLRFKMRSGS
jgi:uncharacterized protein